MSLEFDIRQHERVKLVANDDRDARLVRGLEGVVIALSAQTAPNQPRQLNYWIKFKGIQAKYCCLRSQIERA